MIMATPKKATGNLIWLLLACSCVLVTPRFFFSQTEDLTIELSTTNSHRCDVAEFFGGVKSAAGQPNYIRFAQPKYLPSPTNPAVLVSTAVLKKPFEVLRLDPCTRSNEIVEITGLKLITQEKTQEFFPSSLEFECTNCELQRTEAETIVVRVHGTDAQLVLKNNDQKILNQTNRALKIYYLLRLFAYAGFIISLSWLLIILAAKSKHLLFVFGTSNIAALICFAILYKKRFSLGFNLPFGDDIFESGMALMHLAKYSRYTDVFLYVVPLGLSLTFLTVLLWWRQKKS